MIALTSKRVYKAAFPHELARIGPAPRPGTHFDPAVVDALRPVRTPSFMPPTSTRPSGRRPLSTPLDRSLPED